MKWNPLPYPPKQQHSRGGLCQGSWAASHSATGSPSRSPALGQTTIKANTRRTRTTKTFQSSWFNHSRLHRGSQNRLPRHTVLQLHSQPRQPRSSPSLPAELHSPISTTPSTKTLCARRPQPSTLRPSPCVVPPMLTLSPKANWKRERASTNWKKKRNTEDDLII